MFTLDLLLTIHSIHVNVVIHQIQYVYVSLPYTSEESDKCTLTITYSLHHCMVLRAIPDVKLNGMHLEQLKSHGLCLVYCLIMTNIGAMMISDLWHITCYVCSEYSVNVIRLFRNLNSADHLHKVVCFATGHRRTITELVYIDPRRRVLLIMCLILLLICIHMLC